MHVLYLKMTHTSLLKKPDFRICSGYFFVFAIGTSFIFEIGTFFVFVIDTFFVFEIATFFVFENDTFPISKLHISFLIIRTLRDKVTWEMSTFEMLTLAMSSSDAKTNSENLK